VVPLVNQAALPGAVPAADPGHAVYKRLLTEHPNFAFFGLQPGGHMDDSAHTRMQDVRYKTADGRPGLIGTVEEAIHFIDTHHGAISLPPTFAIAKDALHQTLEGKRPVEESRQLFMAALNVADLLII
jgi:hypothetical protein